MLVFRDSVQVTMVCKLNLKVVVFLPVLETVVPHAINGLIGGEAVVYVLHPVRLFHRQRPEMLEGNFIFEVFASSFRDSKIFVREFKVVFLRVGQA